MILPRFAKYLLPAIVSDEYTTGTKVSNDVIILRQKYIIYLDTLIDGALPTEVPRFGIILYIAKYLFV